MKKIIHLSLCLLLTMLLSVSALATEIPESFVCENLNGQQRIVKTYVLPPDADPDALQEPAFNYEGYHYIWSYTTKEEHPYHQAKDVIETVTVDTTSKDLSVILDQLAPTMAYDDGEYSGELTLDHTTLKTEASGYDTRRSTTTETKVIPNLASNDMSYVPATTTKNGKTLKLADVDWQVTGTAVVGEDLVPAEYQAVATYSASSSYQVATGYVTTAEYKGQVEASGIKDITYVVVYSGSEIQPVAVDAENGPIPARGLSTGNILLYVLLGLIALLLGGILAALYMMRSNVYVYVPGSKPRDFRLVAKYRVNEKEPFIDISNLEPYPEGEVAIEVKRPLAKKLLGKEFRVRCREKEHVYTICHEEPCDWHEFNVAAEEGEDTT